MVLSLSVFWLNATSFEIHTCYGGSFIRAASGDLFCACRYGRPGLECQCLFPAVETSIFGKGLVRVAVQPTFARLRRCNHRMSTGSCVFAGVLIRRAVAAQRDSTRLARPEMNPVAADFYALFAFATMRVLYRLDRNRIQMRTTSDIHDRLARWCCAR
jgi:hypothetical protein